MNQKVIILYGAVGVGKLTTAKLLAEKTGLKLSHNHLINDMLYSLFERGTKEIDELAEGIRFMFYGKAAQAGKSFIITHTYAQNFVSKTGMSDPEYMQKLQEILTNAGARVYFVHLKADSEALIDRVEQESRKEFKKLVDPEVMKEVIENSDFDTSADVSHQLVLDTTGKTVEQSVESILGFVG